MNHFFLFARLLVGPGLLWSAALTTGRAAPNVYEIDARDDQYTAKPADGWLGTAEDGAGHRLGANDHYYTKDGRPWLPAMGECHFTRLARRDWEDELLKMKALGIEIVSTYIIWNHHEEEEGKFEWSGNRDLHAFAELCKKHGLFLIARLGPWSHAEVRNGGFPDWLFEKGRLRSPDPAYLKFVERYYSEIGGQLQGLAFKENGPVIGVQLENELNLRGAPAVKYIKELKRLAVAAGFDVPFYTATAWQGFSDDAAELIPVMGTYPDAPWSNKTTAVLEKSFSFAKTFEDPSIGADIRAADGRPGPRPRIKRYPFTAAELGSGLEVTYHRRVRLEEKDVSTLAVAYLGSGANLLGYYMFHGGQNPLGRVTSLQESRDTFYPNDLPLIDYDFQAPLSAWGQVRSSGHSYRLLHTFLQDFGERLAPMKSFLPEQLPKGPEDKDTFRWAVRTKAGAGFVFLINHQRYVPLGDKRDVQLRVRLANEELLIPSTPFILKEGVNAIWPFNLDMNGAKLIYGTAQPICIIPGADETVYVFSATEGVAPEYVFDPNTVENESGAGLTVMHDNKRLRIQVTEPGLNCVLPLRSKAGRRIRVLTLSAAQAAQAYRIKSDPVRLILTSGLVLAEGQNLRVLSPGKPDLDVRVFPSARLVGEGGVNLAAVTREGIFDRHRVATAARSFKITLQEVASGGAQEAEFEAKSAFPLAEVKAMRSAAVKPGHPYFARGTFQLPEHDKRDDARFVFVADDLTEVWINGHLAGRGGHPRLLTDFSVSASGRPGVNILAVRLRNARGEGKLRGRILISKGEGTPVTPLEIGWKTNDDGPEHWIDPDFNDAAWAAATTIPMEDRIPWRTGWPQPGPLYGRELKPVAAAKTWRVSGVPTIPADLRDVWLRIDYSGDTIAAYDEGGLFADDFQHGLPLTVSLFGLAERTPTADWTVQVVPLAERRDIFMESEGAKYEATTAAIRKVEAIPVYDLHLKFD